MLVYSRRCSHGGNRPFSPVTCPRFVSQSAIDPSMRLILDATLSTAAIHAARGDPPSKRNLRIGRGSPAAGRRRAQ